MQKEKREEETLRRQSTLVVRFNQAQNTLPHQQLPQHSPQSVEKLGETLGKTSFLGKIAQNNLRQKIRQSLFILRGLSYHSNALLAWSLANLMREINLQSVEDTQVG